MGAGLPALAARQRSEIAGLAWQQIVEPGMEVPRTSCAPFGGENP